MHTGLLTEQLVPRSGLPPLLVSLPDRPAERLHYLGTSYGLTQQVGGLRYGFWASLLDIWGSKL